MDNDSMVVDNGVNKELIPFILFIVNPIFINHL